MLQYISDNSGDGDLAQWQKDIIDKNLKEIADNPACLRPIDELFEELDKS
jgi:hypothetical protein